MNELELDIFLDALVTAAEAKGSLIEMNEMAATLQMDLVGYARRSQIIEGCDKSIEDIRKLIVDRICRKGCSYRDVHPGA